MKRNYPPCPYKHIVIIVACFVALHGCGLIKSEPPQRPQRSQPPQPLQRPQLSQPKGAASYGKPRVVCGQAEFAVSKKTLTVSSSTAVTIIEWSDMSALDGWNLVISQPSESARMLIRGEKVCLKEFEFCTPEPISLSLKKLQKEGEVFVVSLTKFSRPGCSSGSKVVGGCYEWVNGGIAPKACTIDRCGLWSIDPISNEEFLQTLQRLGC